MSGFDAASVPTLDYDFTSFPRQSGDGLCTGRGVVKEPSQQALLDFQAAFRALVADAIEATKPAEGEEEPALPTELPEDLSDGGYERILSATIDFCDGSPSEEQLRELPPRVFTLFVNWLLGEFNGPKG